MGSASRNVCCSALWLDTQQLGVGEGPDGGMAGHAWTLWSMGASGPSEISLFGTLEPLSRDTGCTRLEGWGLEGWSSWYKWDGMGWKSGPGWCTGGWQTWSGRGIMHTVGARYEGLPFQSYSMTVREDMVRYQCNSCSKWHTQTFFIKQISADTKSSNPTLNCHGSDRQI